MPKAEIVENSYDLSINKYKEVERIKVEYDKPEVILSRIETLQEEISQAILNYKSLIGQE